MRALPTAPGAPRVAGAGTGPDQVCVQGTVQDTIPDTTPPLEPGAAPAALAGPQPARRSLHDRLGPVAGALLLAAVAVLLQWAALPWLGGRLPFIFILPAVVLAAALWGRAAGATVLVLGLGGSVPLMQQPAAAPPPGEALLLLPLLLMAGIGSLLVALGARLRQRARAAEAGLLSTGEALTQLRGVCLDITTRQRADGALDNTRHALQQRVDDLDMLYQLSSRLLEIDQLEAQLGTILQMLVDAQGACAGMLVVEAADGSGLQAVAATGLDAAAREQVLAAMVATQARLQAGRPGGPTAGRAVERVVVDDTASPATPTTWRLAAQLARARAVHAAPLVSRDGVLLGAIVLLLPQTGPPHERECRLADICARKAAVFIERARAQVALAESARRKDEFLAMLAHELRNPLAPVRQAALLLREPGLAPDRVHWCHAVIERQVAHMALLLDDLLDVSRITRGTLALRRDSAWLQGVVDAALETARPLINARGHRLTLDLPPEPVPLHVDALRLSQVLGNLLGNAARYTGRNGHIVLRGAVDAGGLHLSVSDDGIGIPADGLDQVFEMFSQLQPDGDRVHGGLGIGLALSRALVELHGGQIRAHSAGPGQGSCFSVTLPPSALQATPERERVPAPRPAPPKASPPTPQQPAPVAVAASASGLCMLVADDNRDAAGSLAMLLQLHGHTVHLAYDGEQALAVIARAVPQVCLLDIGMPRRDGYSVARAVRRGAGAQPLLIAVTGWGQAHDRQRALDAGFDNHLTKPVPIDRLLELVAVAPVR